MDFSEYLNRVMSHNILHPSWRIGQSYFNTLNMYRPELAGRVRGSAIDPFYAESPIDQRIMAFVEFVSENWNE